MGSRGRAGLTLVEIAIAGAVLSIAVIGSFGLITAVQSHNQSYSDSRLATKACQEVMELVLLDIKNFANPADWMDKWNHLDDVYHDGRFFTPRLHEPDADRLYQLGKVEIRDISAGVTLPNHAPTPPPGPYLYEVSVRVEGKDRRGNQVTLRPLSVTLISRRSAK